MLVYPPRQSCTSLFFIHSSSVLLPGRGVHIHTHAHTCTYIYIIIYKYDIYVSGRATDPTATNNRSLGSIVTHFVTPIKAHAPPPLEDVDCKR